MSHIHSLLAQSLEADKSLLGSSQSTVFWLDFYGTRGLFSKSPPDGHFKKCRLITLPHLLQLLDPESTPSFIMSMSPNWGFKTVEHKINGSCHDIYEVYN